MTTGAITEQKILHLIIRLALPSKDDSFFPLTGIRMSTPDSACGLNRLKLLD